MDKPQIKNTSNSLRFGYIGQIHMNKGIHILIDAFQQAHLNEHVFLNIWGDMNSTPAYTEKLFSLRGDNQSIVFHGRFDRDQLETVLADIDVLVVPSLWYENAPLVI